MAAVTLRVDVPVRVALSVRAWCAVGRPPGSAPDARSLAEVLVVGQNPVPGRSRMQRASQTLAGRAVVDLSAVGTASSVPCVVQVSPRTESVTGSRMTLVGGSFSATRAQVLTRAGERSTLLVGPPTDPPFREVARTDAAVATARCGKRVRAALRVVHVGGNAVEVEPTLGLPGEVPRVQTHTWVETA